VQVYEDGTKRGDFGAFATGDLLRVAVVGGAVKYSKNGTVFYTSAVAPTYPLLVDTALLTQGATIKNAVLYVQPGPPGPPVAVISAPAPGNVGIALAFDGSGSWDPDGYVVSHAWDFGDGATAAGAAVTHTYESGGTYTVTLTVTDSSGNPATASASVEVSESLVITNVQVTNLTDTAVTVTWQTNIPSTGAVQYGTTSNYGTTTPVSTELAKTHAATLTGLQLGAVYHFRPLAAGPASTEAGDRTFVAGGGGGTGGGRSAADGILPPGMEAGSPVGSYALSGFESVSLFSGNLSFALPLGTIAGRGGAQYTITLPISRTWNVKKEPYIVGGMTGGTTGYWYVPYPDTWSALTEVGQSKNYEPGYSPGVVALRRVEELVGDRCVVSDVLGGVRTHEGRMAKSNTRVAFVSPDGTTHTLEGIYADSFGASQECLTEDHYVDHVGHVLRTRFESTDGSGIVFVPDQPIEDDYSVGEAASYYSTDFPVAAGWLRFRDGTAYRVQDGRVTKIVDRNGNEVDLEYPAQQASWDFSPSRITDSLGRVTTIAQSSSSDCRALDTITFGGYGGASRTLRVCRNDLADALHPDPQIATEAQLFPSLAGLGASQSAPFNPQVVSSVRLPDGREYGFKYSKYGKLTKVTLPTGGVISYEYRPLEVRYVSDAEVRLPFVWHPVSRRVASGQGAETLTTTYAYDIDSYSNYAYVTATETGTGVDSRSLHIFSGRPDLPLGGGVDGPSWEGGREQTTYTMNGAGSPLKSTANGWTFYRAGPQITSQYTTLDYASTSFKTHAYDAFGNLTETIDYDYDYSPIRRTCTQFVSDSAYTDSEHPNPGHPPHLISLPKREAVYVGNSGGDNCTDAGAVAETTYEYDGLPLAGCTGIIHYDNGRDAYGPRGNVTAVNRWLSDPSRWLQSRSTYDIAGNLVWASDPRRYSTSITYGAEGGVYAFPTRVDRQVDGQTVHTTTATYDFNTGKPVSIFDANGVQTTYAYNDALDRLTEAIAAANGGSSRRRMTFTYNDAARTITTTSDVRGDQDGQSQAVYDTLGRTIATRRWSGYEWTRVDTEYDALGRVSRVWNPYYEGSSDPRYSTTTQYDALGRVTAVTAPDNATTTTAYNGATTTVTDPEGKKRSTVTDALGRLASVTEDPGNLGFLTQYSYDVLGNLTQVQQGSQVRDFVYDSLSRLRSATNPESGKVSYEYDDAGNLTRRQDARGIVTMYDGFDGLNRVHQRTYSDGTDAVSFGYDAGTYGKGRMTSVQTSVSGSSYDYDAAGRVQNSSQTMPGGFAYNMSYAYSQGGLLNRLYYPGGRIAEYGHDAAGRTNQVSCLLPGAPGEFQVVQPGHLTYWPNGSIKYLRMWDWVEERFTLNPRNAVESLSFTNTAGSVFGLLALNYEYENNDNVKRQVISGIPGAMPFDQQYSYDPLNRLSNASDSGGWAQTYAYDQFGNRRVPSSSAGPTSGLTPTAEIHINPDNNRIRSCNNGGTVDYDNAGNLTRDCEGQIFAYDAENRLYMSQWPDQESIYYRYNGEGHRIFKNGEAHTIAYVYDASGRLLTESNGIDSKDYVYLGSRLLARALGSPGSVPPVPPPPPAANCPMLAPLPGSSNGADPEFMWRDDRPGASAAGRADVLLLRRPGNGVIRFDVHKECQNGLCRIRASELPGPPTPLDGDVYRWTLDLPGCRFWKFSVGTTIPALDACAKADSYCPGVCGITVPCDAQCKHRQEHDPGEPESTCGWEPYGCTSNYRCTQTCTGTCLAECPADGSAQSLGRTPDCKWQECCNTTSPQASTCEEHAGFYAFQCLATAGDCRAGYTGVGATKDCAQCCVRNDSKPACVGDGFQCNSSGSCPDGYRPYPEATGDGSTCAFGEFCCVRIPADSCTWKRGGEYCSQMPCPLGYDDIGPGSDCAGSCCRVQISSSCGQSPSGELPSCESLCFLGVPCDAPCRASGGYEATAGDCRNNGLGGYCLPWPNTCATCQSLGGVCDPGDCPTGTSLLGNTPDCNFGNCCTRPQPPCVPRGCPAGACGPQSDGCGGLSNCPACTLCTQTAGNQCASNGSCPRGYSVIGPFEDCAQCCTPGPNCTQLAARSLDCLQTGTCLCLQSGSCSTAGHYTDLGQTTDCNTCCRKQTCPEAVPDGPHQCLNLGGSGCPQGSVSIGSTSDCLTCCKYPSCAERGGICEPSGTCPRGYPFIGQTHDCNLCCQIPYCGDGLCDVVNETFISCPQDCRCGDGVCDSQENPSNCHDDCPFL
jgi:YD repeat-containing protein